MSFSLSISLAAFHKWYRVANTNLVWNIFFSCLVVFIICAKMCNGFSYCYTALLLCRVDRLGLELDLLLWLQSRKTVPVCGLLWAALFAQEAQKWGLVNCLVWNFDFQLCSHSLVSIQFSSLQQEFPHGLITSHHVLTQFPPLICRSLPMVSVTRAQPKGILKILNKSPEINNL